MYCPYCGKSNEDGSVFCEHCGKSIEADFDEECPSGGDWGGQDAEPGEGARIASGSGVGKKVALAVVASAVVVAVLVAVLAVAEGDVGGTQDSSGSMSAEVQGESTDGGQAGESAGAKEHRIVFETSGGTTYEPVSAAAGDVVTSPVEPVKNGAAFEGWYSDQGLTMRVSFPYTVKDADPETIVLYAKWENYGQSFSSDSRTGSGYVGNGQSIYYSNCIFPFSSSEYLTEAEIRGLSDWQIQRATNEIYARNGYIFQANAEEKAFFEAQNWYRGTETDQTIVQSRFNDIERANVRLLTSNR